MICMMICNAMHASVGHNRSPASPTICDGDTLPREKFRSGLQCSRPVDYLRYCFDFRTPSVGR